MATEMKSKEQIIEETKKKVLERINKLSDSSGFLWNNKDAILFRNLAEQLAAEQQRSKELVEALEWLDKNYILILNNEKCMNEGSKKIKTALNNYKAKQP